MIQYYITAGQICHQTLSAPLQAWMRLQKLSEECMGIEKKLHGIIITHFPGSCEASANNNWVCKWVIQNSVQKTAGSYDVHMHALTSQCITGQKFENVMIFQWFFNVYWSLFCSPRLHLFDHKYGTNFYGISQKWVHLHIFVNILLYIFMWQHWRNHTLLQCKVVSVQLV